MSWVCGRAECESESVKWLTTMSAKVSHLLHNKVDKQQRKHCFATSVQMTPNVTAHPITTCHLVRPESGQSHGT